MSVASGRSVDAAPHQTYIPRSKAAAVLGPNAPIAVDLPARILSALGSRSDPTVADLLDALRRQRDGASADPPDDAVYRALLDAAWRERRSLSAHRDKPLIYASDRWRAADVRGHEKVPTGGQVAVPSGGQSIVPTSRVSCPG